MMEFGEKLKKLREEKGMTQQKVAERLYVTRQAVSRWECGARYPDLLTAKKLAQILDVSIDEMLSGEELKLNVEREPVLAKPVENILQTVLYTIAVVAFLLIDIFNVYSFFPSGHPVGRVSLEEICRTGGYFLILLSVLAGLKLSIQNRLTAKLTGYIMCLPYLVVSVSFLAGAGKLIQLNGYEILLDCIVRVLAPLLFAVCVFLFFILKDQRIPYGVILLICVVSAGYILLITRHALMWITDLGFVVRTVHCLGEMGMVVLLAYQAHIWNRKRKKAIKSA